MGINPALAKGPLVPGESPFAPGITPPPVTTAAIQALANAKAALLKAKAASTAADVNVVKQKGKLSLAQAQLNSTKVQAQLAYAATMKQVNRQDLAAVTGYNAALKSNLQSVANTYNQGVAQDNITLSQQATKTTQLLRYNVASAYQNAKMTYTPQNLTLPT